MNVFASPGRRPGRRLGMQAVLLMLGAQVTLAAAEMRAPLGEHVHLVSPRLAPAQIQQLVDAVAARQTDNQFGPGRDAVLFEPGTYGSPEHPLLIPVGYYTQIAGLGADPGSVLIYGRIQVRNRCFNGACVALDNFWRAVSNLTLRVVAGAPGCGAGEIWAVSQAAPMRRVRVTGGDLKLTDTCSAPAFASGGFIADSVFEGDVDNGGQQQFFVRNSELRRWVGSNWNQVFAGVQGALPNCAAGTPNCPYVALPTTPVIREAPYLYLDAAHHWRVFSPAVRAAASGTSWGHGAEPGTSQPLDDFFIATPDTGATAINQALRAGSSLLLTPGVYRLEAALEVTRPHTVVLGLGFPTLVPQQGTAALSVHASHGIAIAGLLVEAGPRSSPVLLQLGDDASGEATEPSSLHDVFFRIGGAAAGSAVVSLHVKSSHAILDHVWAWRADHGAGVGWTVNRADTGLVVDGDHVSAYGLFVEHYQKHEVRWNGESGRVVFFQNEMPYDPPSQAAWRASPDEDGYPALSVASRVRHFSGVGWGSYSYFNQGVPVFAERAFAVPERLPPGSLRDVFTIFLNAQAAGGIRHVVNAAGGASTRDNPDIAVRVPGYP